MADLSKKRKLEASAELQGTPLKKRKLGASEDSLSLRSSGTVTNLADLQKLAVARFCSVNEIEKSTNASPVIKAQWDTQKLHSCLSTEELADQLLLSNIMTGHIINGKLWPILLDSSTDPLVQKRTLPFLESLANDWSIFKTLSEQEQIFLTVGIRDLWLADSRGLLNQKEKATLNTILDQLDDDLVPSAEHQSLTFSFCPTKNRRVFKLISHLEEISEIDSMLLQTVAQMKIQMPEDDDSDEVLYAVWVDPRDLSYHNFEFILPLDRALKRKTVNEKDPLEFSVTGVKTLDDKIQIVRGKLEGADTDLLLQLDKLGLYQKPANSSTRGGERFVFSSSVLSSGLTKAIKESKLLKKLCKGIKDDFQFVNYVFRCNRFTPSDAKFDMHLDTPYYDPQRQHISMYTMIIYLSGGSGESILKVLDNNKENRKEVSVKNVDTLDFVVFNQQYEHEGRPFIDTDKIFLRTELIFSYNKDNLIHKPEVSKIFSSAIYMTLESSFQPELSKYAHQLYEKVNAVHWGLTQESDPPLVLQKCWADQIHFATNGSDYWFPLIQQKSTDDSEANKLFSNPHRFIQLAALIAVLDYTNADVKCDDESHDDKSKRRSTRQKKKKEESSNDLFKHFRSNCQVKQISRPSAEKNNTSDDWILKSLWTAVGETTVGSECNEKLPVLTSTEDAQEVFNDLLTNYSAMTDEDSEEKDDEDDEKSSEESFCCPFHSNSENFKPHKNDDVLEEYEEIIEAGHERLYDAPVFIYNKKMYFDEERITIENDKIFVGCGSDALPAVNFASCWPEPPSYFIGINAEISVPNLLMPPISFVMIDANEKTGTGPGIRLMMDFFKNDWIMPNAADLARTVKVPNMEGSGEDWSEYNGNF